MAEEPQKNEEPAQEGEITSHEAEQVGDEPEFAEEKKSFSAKFDDFLHELNISRQHVFTAVGCFVFAIVLIFGGFWGYRYFKNKKNSGPVPAQQAQEMESQPQQVPPAPQGIVQNQDIGIIQTSEIGSPAFAEPAAIGSTGIAAAVVIGASEENRTPIAQYVLIFRQIQNAYAADLGELLNQSTDRRAKLQSYIALLRSLHEDGIRAREFINAELDQLELAYEPQKQRQADADAKFFAELKALNAHTAESILLDFISSGQQMVAIRARFKALLKIEGFYKDALPKLANRIRDIELNEAALVSGIRVYDVQGSSLDLIVPGSGGVLPANQQSSQETLSSPAFPLFPVNPAQLNTGRDFITQPGGGF